MTRIAHFRVAVCLGFKESLGAQPGLVEMSGVFSCKSNSLSLECKNLVLSTELTM